MVKSGHTAFVYKSMFISKLKSDKLSAAPWLLQVDQWLLQIHSAQGGQLCRQGALFHSLLLQPQLQCKGGVSTPMLQD